MCYCNNIWVYLFAVMIVIQIQKLFDIKNIKYILSIIIYQMNIIQYKLMNTNYSIGFI
jgi:hypothetical protein